MMPYLHIPILFQHKVQLHLFTCSIFDRRPNNFALEKRTNFGIEMTSDMTFFKLLLELISGYQLINKNLVYITSV